MRFFAQRIWTKGIRGKWAKNVCKDMTIIMNHENLNTLKGRGKAFKSSKKTGLHNGLKDS